MVTGHRLYEKEEKIILGKLIEVGKLKRSLSDTKEHTKNKLNKRPQHAFKQRHRYVYKYEETEGGKMLK